MSESFEVDCTESTFGVFIGKQKVANVHDPSACEGRGCPIHHPSDHHMKDWPLLWRGDKGIFERICSCDTGHPDPDSIAYMKTIGVTWVSVHGCCGHCVSLVESADE